MEVIVQDLEKKWTQVQENALKQPSPGILHYPLIYVYSWFELPLYSNRQQGNLFFLSWSINRYVCACVCTFSTRNVRALAEENFKEMSIQRCCAL